MENSPKYKFIAATRAKARVEGGRLWIQIPLANYAYPESVDSDDVQAEILAKQAPDGRLLLIGGALRVGTRKSLKVEEEGQ